MSQQYNPPKPLVDVVSGDPITSEQWNNILAAIRNTYEILNLAPKRLGDLIIRVTDKAGGNEIPGATVTAIPTPMPAVLSDRPYRTALYAGGSVKRYRVDQLRAGSYNVVVEADGFDPETRAVTMDEAGTSLALEVQMKVTEVKVRVPALFGRPLHTAIDMLDQAGLVIASTFDSHGKSIYRVTDKDVLDAPVLGQTPEAGAEVPKNTWVQMLVAAKPEFAEQVKVPNLVGLGLQEAIAALKTSGLVLGEVSSAGPK